MIFVDANVPMYAAGRAHSLRAPCQEILHAIGDGNIDAVSDAEVVQEILHRYTALGLRREAVALARAFSLLVPALLPVTGAVVRLALDLHLLHRGLEARDSLHLAVMKMNGIDTILTADRHFDRVPGIRRVDPRKWREAVR